MAKHWRVKARVTLRLGFRVFIAALISCCNGHAVGFDIFVTCLWLLAPIIREAIKAFSERLSGAGRAGNVQLRMRVRSSSAQLLKLAFIILQIVEEILNLTQQEPEMNVVRKMIRIYNAIPLLRKLFAQLSVKLVARMAKHWQRKARVTLRLGFRVFIAALISCCNGHAVGFATFVLVPGA